MADDMTEDPMSDWVRTCTIGEVDREDVMRFDLGDSTFAVVHTKDDKWSVIDGLCTHGRAHLAEGFVHGAVIECPKHNGRFDALTGEPKASPVRVAVRKYDTRVVDGHVEFRLG